MFLCRHRPLLAVLVTLMASCPLPASAQEPLQFNVPYRCADGTTYIIQRCQAAKRGEVCFWREEKNGQLVTESYSARGQMYGRLQGCTVEGRTQTQPPQPAQPPTNAQLNPPYLALMPSPRHIVQTVQGSDPTDTVARQVAVFNLLPSMIGQMQPPNRGTRTPDEQRVISAYTMAAYQLSQDFSKSHTPQEVKTFEGLHNRYEMDRAIRDLIVNQVFSPAMRAEYQRVDAANQAHFRSRAEAQKRESESQTAQAAAGQGQSPVVRNDPGTLAARRCVELGGNALLCAGKGLYTGLFDIGGVNLEALKPPERTGLVMSGTYLMPRGVSVAFDATFANLGGCGKLVLVGHKYTMEKKGIRFLVHVESEPRSFVLVLGPDGKMAGPGPIDIKGSVIVGYRTYRVAERNTSDNSIIPGTEHDVQEPITAPKTERCTIGVLAPRTENSKPMGGLLGAVLDNLTSKQTGPRMNGQYSSSGGLKIEFDPESAVLDCGEAHVRDSYTVENTPNELLVKIQNLPAPLNLLLQPNGTLAGSGAVEVAGRVVTGGRGDDILFAPRRARCVVGTLAPQGGPAGQ